MPYACPCSGMTSDEVIAARDQKGARRVNDLWELSGRTPSCRKACVPTLKHMLAGADYWDAQTKIRAGEEPGSPLNAPDDAALEARRARRAARCNAAQTASATGVSGGPG